MADTKLPFITIFSRVLLAIVLLVLILYIGRDLLMPLALSAFIAVLLNPFVNFLHRHRIPRAWAITIAIVAAFIVLAGVLFFCVIQIAHFSEELPQLERKLTAYAAQLQSYIEDHFNIRQSRQSDFMRQGAESALKNSGAFIGSTLLTLTSLTIFIFLVPVYVFLFLYYKELLKEFFFRLASRRDQGTMGTILQQSSAVIQRYLEGRLIETVIVTVLNTAALFALGIDYALLFGVIAGLLNLIPYIGVFIGSLLPTLMALITKDSIWYAVAVVGTFSVIQFIDNHVIMPLIVGGKVKINSLVAIAALIAGAQIWGVIGMILSLPIVAICKIVFDQIAPLKPWGLLLGDDMPGKEEK